MFLKYLINERLPSSRTPCLVLLPVLVKSVLRAPVPDYWMLIMSAWSAHTFLNKFSNMA